MIEQKPSLPLSVKSFPRYYMFSEPIFDFSNYFEFEKVQKKVLYIIHT